VQALKVRRLINEDYLKVWAQNVDLLLTPVTLSDAPLYSEFLKLDPRAQSAQQVSSMICQLSLSIVYNLNINNSFSF
jgi:Asp-tRNA(Asn)/Glu-tRNA(Gln) amidotransferase A subunit family amidase